MSTTVKRLIQSIAIHIHNRGISFERELFRKIQKSSNPSKWAFLTDSECEDHLYYKWCVLVLGNNESFSQYSLLPFQFIENQSWYLPPPVFDEDESSKTLDSRIAKLNFSVMNAVKRSSEERDGIDEEKEKKRKLIEGYVVSIRLYFIHSFIELISYYMTFE